MAYTISSKEIYLDAPNLGVMEKEYLNKAIDAGYVSTAGPFVAEFEKKFSRYLKVDKAVSLQSGTSALHTSLYELGIKKGDEVIVPALTFVGTVNPVVYVGAAPRFVDVDIRTWNISPKEIEKNINKKTRAIIPVHLYGNPCEMGAIMKIAKRHGLSVVEDATESLGATYKGRYTGTFGDMGCFSFNGNKVITTGGGGMVVGHDGKRLEHIKFLVNQARDESRGYYHPEVGFNNRMTNIEAALGLAQIEKLNDFLAKKALFVKIYEKELKGIRHIRIQEELPAAKSSRWLMCIMLERKAAVSAVQKKLAERNVPSRRVFMPITEFPPYQSYKRGNYENSYAIHENGLCLPNSTLNSEKNIYYICGVLKKILKGE